MLPRYQFATLLMTLSLLSALTGQVQAQETAPIMPLASKALLLDISPAGDRLVAAGEHGIVLYSDDNGSHWQQAAVPTTRMLTSIHFVDGRHGWAVGHDGLILVSNDGGENWRIQRDGLALQHQTNLELRETAHRQRGGTGTAPGDGGRGQRRCNLKLISKTRVSTWRMRI